MLGVYIHIPFCSNICSYCDFCKINYDKKYTNLYLESLEKEIKKRYKNELVNTIYIGGGTPSSLDIYELNKLFSIIKIFKLANDVEFTFECNVDDLTLEKLKILKDNKVNRISLGVQSFDENNLKILNRKHTKDDIFRIINMIKKIGIENINIDLIYGVNGNISVVKKDIAYFLELNIPHISCYSLIIEDNTILKNNHHDYIDEDIDYEMYKEINKLLENNNYHHYEISNYALSGYESKHNLNYWNNGYYYGFGLSSVSFIDNKRITNTRNLHKYLDHNYIASEVEENIAERIENEIILGLRKIEGINLIDFYSKYHQKLTDIYNIDKLLKEKKLIMENNYLKINKTYLYLSNEILINFLKE